jgi:hypothetical protein
MWSTATTILPITLTTWSLMLWLPNPAQAERIEVNFYAANELSSHLVDTSLEIDLQYVPPNRGTPDRRSGGGTR